ncbi:hypothetical protein EW026_g6689 [Hermanssonia centrifuga]|uniref:Uncharacterized protein n=1 Tax=Hermanssonia centrifuga TaxID=98765 RepID=A0A4S4KB61_9APHY|nr:hypothetical protein EW026_g6689 [Hermanssonia centrifuga]
MEVWRPEYQYCAPQRAHNGVFSAFFAVSHISDSQMNVNLAGMKVMSAIRHQIRTVDPTKPDRNTVPVCR